MLARNSELADQPPCYARWWRLRIPPRDDQAIELLDLPDVDTQALRGNLRDIRLVNRLGGGTRVILRGLAALVQRVPRHREITILDLATGSGDIPLALANWMRRAGRRFEITVTDSSPQVLDEAKNLLAHLPEVTFSLSDARAAPFATGSFDIVLCSLALHHFAPGDAVRVLREMERLSRVGFVLNDIRRCRTGYLVALVTSRIGTRNRLTRHDMPLSVRRAYTPAELRSLLRQAGINHAKVARHPLFRMSAVRIKPEFASDDV